MRRYNFILGAMLALVISSQQTLLADKDDDLIRCAKEGSQTFLFAHGLNGKPQEWDTFHDYIKEMHPTYGIWRTKVKGKGHIKERAHELAEFMQRAEKKCLPSKKSVVAVGHSMGGLDLRYIVGNKKTFEDQLKLVDAVYTIATPHLGDPNACAALKSGIHDLCGHPKNPDNDSPMKSFNKNYPASDFVDRKIHFRAFYYECAAKEKGEDGVVLIESQKWEGHTKHSENRGNGYHKTKDCSKKDGCVPELCQEDEIKHILSLEIARNAKLK